MNYLLRYSIFIVMDSLNVLFAVFVSYWIINPTQFSIADSTILITAISLLISHHFLAFTFHLYTRIWKAASVPDLLRIDYAITLSVLFTSVVQFSIKSNIDFRTMVIIWFFLHFFIGGSRFFLRLLHDRTSSLPKGKLKRVLIVGAGEAGTMLLRSIKRKPTPEYVVVAIVDDDPYKQNLSLWDVKVCGTTKDIPRIVQDMGIEIIILAIPSLGKFGLRKIYDQCKSTKVKIKTMPKIEDIMLGKRSVSDVKEVKIEDLLGRKEVTLDMQAISKQLYNNTILVTGAGGSIGSEICRQVASFRPKQIIMLGHGEYSIYSIHLELLENEELKNTEFIPVIADVQDRERIFEVVQQYQPDIIYHAAAHKHVPLMEQNPKEAVKNNIFGTKNIAEAAHEIGVKNFVLISTDKAVNPTNVMGATKRISEMLIQNLARFSSTNFAAVRFGNVLGSRGSVLPRFKAQIAAGGPVTITHPQMTRFFMTIPEASRLVLQAGVLAKGGEVFVLDMGEPIKIVDLAKNLIQFSGYTVDEIGIEYTGIRPGEKLYEELLNVEEIQTEFVYPQIHVGKANYLEEEKLLNLLQELQELHGEELKTRIISVVNERRSEGLSK